MNKEKGMVPNAPSSYEKAEYNYKLTVGWGNNDLKFALAFNNIFNRGWATTCQTTYSPIMENHATFFGTYFHPQIQFTASYTVGYGKKIQRGNEVGAQKEAESTILHR